MHSKVLSFAVLAAMAQSFLMSQEPKYSCSPDIGAGYHVVSCTGWVTPGPNAPLVPFSLLGTVSGDRNGDYKGTSTISLGGTILQSSVTGKAKTNRDCTGTVTYAVKTTGAPDSTLNINFVVHNEGRRTTGMSTDRGSVLICELNRISQSIPD